MLRRIGVLLPAVLGIVLVLAPDLGRIGEGVTIERVRLRVTLPVEPGEGLTVDLACERMLRTEGLEPRVTEGVRDPWDWDRGRDRDGEDG